MGLFDSVPFGNTEEKRARKERELDRQQVSDLETMKTASMDDQTQVYHQESRSDVIRWQQELADELLNLIQILLGKHINEKGDWVETKHQLCNEVFIEEVIIPQCSPYLSRNLFNSNLEEKRILLNLRNTMHDIVNSMADNYNRYNIKFYNLDLVVRVIQNVINPSPFRAYKGFTKKMDSTMIKRLESFQDSDKKQKSFFEGG